MSDQKQSMIEELAAIEEKEAAIEEQEIVEEKPRKRPWKLRLAELLLWFAVAVATAVIMVSMSEQLLPSNF